MLERWQRGLATLAGEPPLDRLPSKALCEIGPPPAPNYKPLRRVLLTEGVVRALFDEYSDHRLSERGGEETGWLLLGWRDEEEAIIRATLPAGADREAGEAHVRFNSTAQAVASRIARQADRRLALLGVVHTHPGTLRHPSDGDFRGDIRWVGQLRGGEGIFGIGTANDEGPAEFQQPRASVLRRGGLTICWYSLRDGGKRYHPVSVKMIDGADLATALRPTWAVIEGNAERLERLARQQSRLGFEVAPPSGLAAVVPLADGDALRAVLTKEGVRYFLVRNGEPLASELHEPRVDRGIYRLLAELADGDES
jgi:Prokaryotic homologs of the JAB domain